MSVWPVRSAALLAGLLFLFGSSYLAPSHPVNRGLAAKDRRLAMKLGIGEKQLSRAKGHLHPSDLGDVGI